MFGTTKGRWVPRIRRRAGFAFLVGFEVGAIAALHAAGSLRWLQLPWNDLPSWIEMAPVEDVVAALLRSVALAVAYWLALTTAAYSAARLTRIPALIRATARTTLPQVRAMVDRAVAVTVTTTALSVPLSPALGPDIADEAPPTTEPIVYQISDQGVPTPLNPEPAGPTLIIPPGVGGAGYTPNPAGGVTLGEAAQVATEPATYEVVPGDNLWTISERHLKASQPERDIGSSEIAVYWRRVIEANTPTLRSGDPNLIYPGESILLPAHDQGGTS